MYAYYKKLDYFSTECIYAPHAARGVARELVKELEMVRPSAIVDVIRSVEELRFPGVLRNGIARCVMLLCKHCLFCPPSLYDSILLVVF